MLNPPNGCIKPNFNSYTKPNLITSYSLYGILCRFGFFTSRDSAEILNDCSLQPSLSEAERGDFVFLCPEASSTFFNQLKYLNQPINIIFGRSDTPFDESWARALNHPMISAIFAQNNLTEDFTNVFSLPLGLENFTWKNDNSANSSEILEKSIKLIPRLKQKKLFKIYANFNLKTNLTERRSALRSIMCLQDVCLDQFPNNCCNASYEKFFNKISLSKFVICPHGNGVDTHRLWQSLYLGSIPITKYSQVYRSILNAPIVFVNSYDEIAKLNFDSLYARLTKEWIANICDLSLNHLIAKIRSISDQMLLKHYPPLLD